MIKMMLKLISIANVTSLNNAFFEYVFKYILRCAKIVMSLFNASLVVIKDTNVGSK